MKTLTRTIVWLALIVWLGGLFFFPITAAAAFTIIPDTHAAGSIVARCLGILHHEGIVAGGVILVFLGIGRGTRAYAAVGMAAVVTLIMVGLTAFSQYWIIPHMERDRIAVGGDVNAVEIANPARIHFNKLHVLSERVEQAILLMGLGVVCLVARAETTRQ